MASSPEILPYKLDITDVEAKAARMVDLMQKIAAGRAAKTDTSEFERQLESEMVLLNRSKGKTEESANAVQTLVKSKEKLGSVVGLLGGQFGGMIGQLGNVIELFIALGAAAAVPAAVIAGITLVVGLLNQQAEAARKAAEEVKKLDDAEKQRRDAGKAAALAFNQKAEAAGIFGYGAAGEDRAVQLMKDGVSRDLAEFQSIAEQLGLSEQDAAAAARGKLVGGDAGLGRDQNLNRRKLAALIRLGNQQQAIDAMSGHVASTGEAAAQEAAGLQTRDVSTTNYAGELNRFIAERNLPADVAQGLRDTIRTGKPTDYSNLDAQSYFIAQRIDRLAEEFRSNGLQRSEQPPPQQIFYVNQNFIQTQTIGAGGVMTTPWYQAPAASNRDERR